jgi:hypothetical protein
MTMPSMFDSMWRVFGFWADLAFDLNMTKPCGELAGHADRKRALLLN